LRETFGRFDFTRRDVATHVGLAEIHHRRVGADSDRFGHAAHLERDVQHDGLSGHQADTRLLILGETGEFSGDRETAQLQERRTEQAGLIGDDHALRARVGVEHRR
jgi:hypothetical protein